MDTILFFAFSAAYLALFIWGSALTARRGRVDAAAIPLLIIAALVYDNTVKAAGQWIGEGPLLEGLSLARFWIHAIVTPLLAVWAWHVCRRTGVRWASTRTSAVVAVLYAVVLIVIEYITVLSGLRLEAREEYGVLSYGSAESPNGPPLMVLLVVAALLVAGIVAWMRHKTPVLLIGTILMTIGSAVPIPMESGAITNAFELALLTSIVWTTARQDAMERRHSLNGRAAGRGSA